MWKMSKIQLVIWTGITVFSLILIIIRTMKFGWFEGKDALLWLVLVYAFMRTSLGIKRFIKSN